MSEKLREALADQIIDLVRSRVCCAENNCSFDALRSAVLSLLTSTLESGDGDMCPDLEEQNQALFILCGEKDREIERLLSELRSSLGYAENLSTNLRQALDPFRDASPAVKKAKERFDAKLAEVRALNGDRA